MLCLRAIAGITDFLQLMRIKVNTTSYLRRVQQTIKPFPSIVDRVISLHLTVFPLISSLATTARRMEDHAIARTKLGCTLAT
jgi:hypothetical protein